MQISTIRCVCARVSDVMIHRATVDRLTFRLALSVATLCRIEITSERIVGKIQNDWVRIVDRKVALCVDGNILESIFLFGC